MFTDPLVLKGGTALKKAYSQDYRFSEDLDFSTRVEITAADIQDGIDTAISILEQDLQEREPFFIRSEPLILREPHPGKQIAYIVRVQCPYHREPMCRLKVEITVDEPILIPPETRPILHNYEETILTRIKTYHLAKIIAEKYRALLHSLDRLQKGMGSKSCLPGLLRSVEYFKKSGPVLSQYSCVALEEKRGQMCQIRKHKSIL